MSDTAQLDVASAQEVLRQAQLLIAGQFDASKALDTKANSVLQASLSLAGASLGAAAFAFNDRPWLPIWAAPGLAVSGTVFVAAAYFAASALRRSDLAAGALRPAKLLGLEAERWPPARLYLAIAFELDRAIRENEIVEGKRESVRAGSPAASRCIALWRSHRAHIPGGGPLGRSSRIRGD